MFKTTLFKLFAKADKVMVSGYEIDSFDQSDGGKLFILGCSDDFIVAFADQEVTVLDDGNCKAVETLDDDAEPDEVPQTYWVECTVQRPITEGDLL